MFPKIPFLFPLQGLNNKFTSIKNQVSDLHRDVTTRRCLTSYKQVENIVMDCASLTDEIEQTDQLMRERKELFHKMWEEEQQRITIEQTIFKEQVKQVNPLDERPLEATKMAGNPAFDDC